jgi:hypothetical protein
MRSQQAELKESQLGQRKKSSDEDCGGAKNNK